ncbi:phage integrase family protein [Salinibacterium sp. dk2585]|uniref:tyrosine-type recombinase/integrase n=1 Tax=unclassified Salinibacterium TaxID=2632331 RepID=UPI0011C25808|nr:MULTISPECIES: tyrosine-type recombinase/integrase [unclassified Salinibacterium]QEE62452.1 phage integrase family protein [Salinibacterium sp. dk2585]TXK55167.1 phage integrase family protein [Salinibacterium sp. dk5596]
MTPLGRGIEHNNHAGYSNEQSSACVTHVIEDYTPMLPRRFWNDVAEFTRSATTDFAPRTEREARRVMSAVARLAIWTTDVACLPLERHIVFDGRHIDRYILHGAPTSNDYGLRRRRLQLMNVAAELHEFDEARRDAGATPPRQVYAPYTAAEVVRFRSQGSTRTTVLRRHNWMVLMALGAGCGLTTPEICGVTVTDINTASGTTRVSVGGKHARTVVCLAEWEEEIASLVTSTLVRDYLFVASTGLPRTAIQVKGFIHDAANGRERFTVERLRSTWIVGHLQHGVPPVELINALGMTTFATLQRFIPYIAGLDEEERTILFRREVRS